MSKLKKAGVRATLRTNTEGNTYLGVTHLNNYIDIYVGLYYYIIVLRGDEAEPSEPSRVGGVTHECQ